MKFDFREYEIDLSKETMDKLEVYNNLLAKWQKSINLVSNNTIKDAVERHFLDSAQLIKYIENKDLAIADMGSGAGFPGLVLAIMGIKEVNLIESDARKCEFMRQVSRETFCKNVTVHNKRIENCSIDNLDLVTARALAPIRDLLAWADALKTGVDCLFLKGEKAEEEIKDALKDWDFDYKLYKSDSDPKGNIVKIEHLSKK